MAIVNIGIAKVKVKNYLRSRQELWALAATVLLKLGPFVELLLRTKARKLRFYDLYLRFNPRAPHAPAVLQKAVSTAASDLKSFSDQESTQFREDLVRSIILKPYVSPREKGFLLVSFESELLKLAQNPHLGEIEQQYEIAFLPTWQPFFSLPLYQFLARIKEPFWIMPSAMRDADLCRIITPLCRALPFQASSWIEDKSFLKASPERDIDLIMVANFSEYKRHWLLFEALRDLPRSLKVAIVGRGIGTRTREVLMAEAALFGVTDRFEVIESPSNEKIRELLGRAKLFCALSAKEGSYIAVAEALFAGTPVGIYENAIIGSKDYINSKNGIFFNPKEKLSQQLLKFIQSSTPRFQPVDIQKWAFENISARVNCEKLNAIVRDTQIASGGSWTLDLRPFYCKNFDFYYTDQPLEIDEYERLARDFSLSIATPWRSK